MAVQKVTHGIGKLFLIRPLCACKMIFLVDRKSAREIYDIKVAIDSLCGGLSVLLE